MPQAKSSTKRKYWLVKEEPQKYAWYEFEKDGIADWSGVRNYQARNNLRAMAEGDWVFYYHSVKEKRIMGLAEVVREAYPDPTASEGDWSAVDLKPLVALKEPVELGAIKADADLSEMALVRQSRLSVMPVTDTQLKKVFKIGKTPVPKKGLS